MARLTARNRGTFALELVEAVGFNGYTPLALLRPTVYDWYAPSVRVLL